MTIAKSLAVLSLALGLAGCVAPDTASRGNTPIQALTVPQSDVTQMRGPLVLQSQYIIDSVNIDVPRNLRVSEANVFHPNADIVWRGEPIGDRYAQIGAIFNEAFASATAKMHSGRHVAVDIRVSYFHCLTEKARYTFGGVHSMHFILTVRDAATGAVIDGPRKVSADVKAAGGAKAIAEEEAGVTQRVVVLRRLAEVLRRELSTPAVVAPNANVVSRFQTELLLPSSGTGQ